MTNTTSNPVSLVHDFHETARIAGLPDHSRAARRKVLVFLMETMHSAPDTSSAQVVRLYYMPEVDWLPVWCNSRVARASIAWRKIRDRERELAGVLQPLVFLDRLLCPCITLCCARVDIGHDSSHRVLQCKPLFGSYGRPRPQCLQLSDSICQLIALICRHRLLYLLHRSLRGCRRLFHRL